MAFTDYAPGGALTAGSQEGPTEAKTSEYRSLSRLKREYMDYVGNKREEIDEQQNSRRYRHGTQWTAEQIKVLNRRKQPIVTYNRIAPKINGVIGLLEKIKQAPKAYPRTPKEESASDIATMVMRDVLDTQEWKVKSPICGENAAVDGFAGVEITIEKGDMGDPDVGIEVVDSDSFFYDPRSYRHDFSDCRFMGQGKWLDLEAAIEMFPDHEEDLRDSLDNGSDMTTQPDREQKWFISDGDTRRVRVIDHWYKMNSEWCYCIYTGSVKLTEGKSYLTDEKGKTFCKYIMFSAAIDQDGDRYGFVRQFKSAQDEINQRRSKGLHLLNSRRIKAQKGAFDNIEETRIEAARSDGVVEANAGFEFEFDDATRLQETEAQIKFLQEAKEELDSYGPTLSLIGETGTQLSGRAISLQQQAGVAQLGPFILSNKSWKIRVYRAIWNAVRQHWQAERWLRVTDNEGSVQFVGVNQIGVNPQTGMPGMVNQLAAMDVDIIIDEGPDSINMQADTFDALSAIVQGGTQIPPDVLIQLAPGIDAETRKEILDRMRQPDPVQQQAQQLELQHADAKVKETQAAAGLKQAQTMDTLRGEPPGPQEHPAVTQANIENTQADTDEKRANMMAKLQEAFTPQPPPEADPKVQMAAQAQSQDMENKAAEARRKDEEHQMKMRQAQAKLHMDVQAHQANLKAMSEKPAAGASGGGGSKGPTSLEDVGKTMTETAAHNKQMTVTANSIMEHHATAANAMSQAAQAIAKAVSEIKETQQETSKLLSAKRTVKRGKDGRISHVEIG